MKSHTKEFSRWNEIHLKEVKLSDLESRTEAPDRIQILRAGNYTHPFFGEFKVTPQDLQVMKENFENNVVGTDLSIDYDHNNAFEAAAWIRQVELENNDTEMFMTIEWTDEGRKKVESKLYRYTSVEFDPEFVDNETKKEFGPTLRGGALTNRPFVKRMKPIVELSEGKGQTMQFTEEEVKGLKAKLEDMEKQLKAKDEEIEASKKAQDEMKKKLQDMEKDKEASEKKASEERAMNEKKDKFDKMLSEGKVVEGQREAFMKDDFETFANLQQPVKLSEKGDGKEPKKIEGKDDPDFEKEITKLSEEAVKNGRAANLGDAMAVVLNERQDLNKKYEEKYGIQ